MIRFPSVLLLALLLPIACTTPPSATSTGSGTQPNASTLQALANDALVATTIKAKLIALDPDSATAINVAVANGVATIGGTVRTVGARAQVIATARSASGITRVIDHLTIDPAMQGLSEHAADATIAARIEGALFAEKGATGVHVAVERGVVTLSGLMPDPKVRAAALATARDTTGVKRVIDAMDPPVGALPPLPR
jgi:osmotically-inducible protein OsmY